ncbi:unnamed protein product [Auanema sp. JU1783]|nr:unnamed protein product [Auanema sp. JU1783]
MYCLSFVGMFTIVFSMYLLLTVPTKLTPFTRFVIHGHDLITGFAQLFGTLGVQAHIIFPCASGYTTGLFTQLRILSTLNQTWVQVALIAGNQLFLKMRMN